MRKALSILIATAALSACAGVNQLSNDVSTYSLWPADRKPTTYTFERLPSQQANAQQQQVLEEAAHRAMTQAGFTLANDPSAADVTVTLGARVTAQDRSPYDDPFWWRGGLYGYRHFVGRPYYYRGFGPHFGYPFYDTTTYEREVAMLIRDRKTGQPLYEARVTNDGYSPSINSLLSAMFEAGLKDFPRGGANPRRVVTQIAG
jgi:hypothetical protein